MMEKGLSAQSKVTVDGGNVAATMGSGDLQGWLYQVLSFGLPPV